MRAPAFRLALEPTEAVVVFVALALASAAPAAIRPSETLEPLAVWRVKLTALMATAPDTTMTAADAMAALIVALVLDLASEPVMPIRPPAEPTAEASAAFPLLGSLSVALMVRAPAVIVPPTVDDTFGVRLTSARDTPTASLPAVTP